MSNAKPKFEKRNALAGRLPSALDTIMPNQRPAGVEDLDAAKSIAVDLLESNPYQPRTTFNEVALAELAADIAAHGVLQPLLVRPHPTMKGHYQIVAGERRWRAAKEAGKAEVPCIEQDMDNATMERLALVENIQRADLDPVDEARTLRSLMERAGILQEDLARSIHKDTSYITLRLRLLKDERIAAAVSAGKMSPTVGQEAALIEDPAQRSEVIERADRGERVTVRQVKTARAPREKASEKQPQPAREAALPAPPEEVRSLNNSTPPPVDGLNRALGALGALAARDVAALDAVLDHGIALAWSCQELARTIREWRSEATP